MAKALISILLAFAGYSILNISQAVQKFGLGLLPGKRIKGLTIWTLATLSTTGSIFIVLCAVAIGSVSLVGAMAGTGLASLAVFSNFVMKEKIGKREIMGILIILSGAAFIGALAAEPEPKAIKLTILFILLSSVSVFYILSLLILRKNHGFIGILIGGFAGALGGFIPLFQKVTALNLGRTGSLLAESSWFGGMLTNIYALIWILLSIVSMLILQFSYKWDKAIRIIPAFTANYIMIPVLGGVICFTEKLHLLQWLGVVFILIGVFLLTVKPEKIKKSTICSFLYNDGVLI